MMAQIAGSLLPAALPLLYLHDSACALTGLLALLAVAAGTGQVQALSRAALSGNGNSWLRGGTESSTDDGSDDEGRDEGAVSAPDRSAKDADSALFRRVNAGIARVATRLLELAARAVPEIVLYPCPRIADIARVAATTQPDTVRRFALYGFYGYQAVPAKVLGIWKLACRTWGPSSLRDLRIAVSPSLCAS
jgi:hypothetical protein